MICHKIKPKHTKPKCKTLSSLLIRIYQYKETLSLIGIILRWGILIWELIFFFFFLSFFRTFCPHLGSFFWCFLFHYISAKFHLWPSSGDLLRPRIGMLSLVTVSPVITAFHSCCLLHHIFDQVNLWPAWVGFETAIFWQCSPGTEETQCLCPLCHGPWRVIKDRFFGLINPIICFPYLVFHSQVHTEFVIVFNCL